MESVLRYALDRRRANVPTGTDAFRWLDFEIEELTVDLFGDVAVASSYRERNEDEEQEVAEALGKTARTVYWKRRPREARRAANESPDAVAPKVPHHGPRVEELVCKEDGLSFTIRPANGLSVGLYLDARDARAWVRQRARGRSVLNLFSYTCGFGVAALAGGATRAVNVDASRKVLDWGEANLKLNGFEPKKDDFISGDARDWLKRLAKKGERFGLVVLDPPSFASVGDSRWSAATDYPELVAEALECVEPSGRMLACCNLEKWSAKEFLAEVQKGAPGAKFTEQFGASSVDFKQPSAFKAVTLQKRG